MAPEQAEDPHGVDTRADIYSFGATFYHALTGQPPFEGETAFSILYKHKTEPLISPRARNQRISERTTELLERCLAKSPHDRFSSFAEVLKNLLPAAGATSPWTIEDDSESVPYWTRFQARRIAYLSGQLVWQEADTYDFPRGQILKILRDTIVDQDVDAVVSSDTDHLTMDYGVSRALRLAAGPALVEEATRLVPVLPGRAVVTTGGALRARFIFHGVTSGALSGYPSEWVTPNPNLFKWLLGNRWAEPSRDLISEIMSSCFYHADTLQVRSIAFPLLGTGGAGFSKEVCLDTMFRFLARMFLRGLTSVREARIVLFD